jgi:hypothetical protein
MKTKLFLSYSDMSIIDVKNDLSRSSWDAIRHMFTKKKKDWSQHFFLLFTTHTCFMLEY